MYASSLASLRHQTATLSSMSIGAAGSPVWKLSVTETHCTWQWLSNQHIKALISSLPHPQPPPLPLQCCRSPAPTVLFQPRLQQQRPAHVSDDPEPSCSISRVGRHCRADRTRASIHSSSSSEPDLHRVFCRGLWQVRFRVRKQEAQASWPMCSCVQQRRQAPGHSGCPGVLLLVLHLQLKGLQEGPRSMWTGEKRTSAVRQQPAELG